MAVGEMYMTQIEEAAVAIDLSPHIARLASQASAYGAAYAETLATLGFSNEEEVASWEPRMILRGNLATARAQLPELRRQVGSIAQLGAAAEVSFHSYNQDRLQDIVEKLANCTLPALAPDAPLAGVTFAIAYPFAKEIMTSGVRGHINHCKAPWRASVTEVAVQKKKEALFGTYDCIPLSPALDPEQELAELDARPDQTAWWEYQRAAMERAREADAIDFLRGRGFTISNPQTEDVA